MRLCVRKKWQTHTHTHVHMYSCTPHAHTHTYRHLLLHSSLCALHSGVCGNASAHSMLVDCWPGHLCSEWTPQWEWMFSEERPLKCIGNTAHTHIIQTSQFSLIESETHSFWCDLIHFDVRLTHFDMVSLLKFTILRMVIFGPEQRTYFVCIHNLTHLYTGRLRATSMHIQCQ